MRAIWLILLLPLLSGCVEDTYTPFTPEPLAHEPEPGPVEEELPTIPAPPMPVDRWAGETVQFVVLGDQGTQDQDQRNVAQALKQVCDDLTCDFALALGDNIYNIGPIMGTDDPQFDAAFETPYADFDMPFYMTLGNHDNGGTGHLIVHGDYEVAYTYKEGTSGKWQLPSRYYNQTFNDGFLEIWSLDTDTLTAGDSTSGIRLGPDILYERDAQVAWMKDSIGNSDARWKIAFGHYQYQTEGYKGDGNGFLKESFQEFLCDQVPFYFYGHQHQLRWEAAHGSCGRTEFINSGAGARGTHEPGFPDDLGIEERFVYEDGAGFWWMELNATSMTAIAYGMDPAEPTTPVELFRRTTTLDELGW